MPRAIIAASACCVLLALSASVAKADVGDDIRRPLGVYAKIDVETAEIAYEKMNPPPAESFREYLYGLCETLLRDPAISGFMVGTRWNRVQRASGFYWTYLDDAFYLANLSHKTVQLLITPGVDTPPSVQAGITPCVEPFPASGAAPAGCTSVKFARFPEELRADSKIFPMAWSTVYNNAWASFLGQLDDRYYRDYPFKNPAFVGIAIAGPVGASSEMIYPTSLSDKHPQPSGLTVDETWAAVIKNSFPPVVNGNAYWKTDQVFIDYWGQTVSTYESIFSGITLSLIPDSGDDLPEFADNTDLTVHSDNLLFKRDCGVTDIARTIASGDDPIFRSCEAKTEILTQFLTLLNDKNARATDVGGMTARSVTSGDIGLPGVKLLTTPVSLVPYLPPLLGGAEFDFAVSGDKTIEEGCPTLPLSTCANLGVEDAAYYVLRAFFDGTSQAEYYKGTKGKAVMRYLGVPYIDVLYAQTYPCQKENPPSTIIPNTSMQDLLNRASHDLYEMAGEGASLPPLTCSPVIKR